MTEYYTIPIGHYKCGSCGAIVPSGSTHYCTPQTYTYTWGSFFIDQETKEILKRIADALEKIAGQQ